MSEMVERVARAICWANNRDPDWLNPTGTPAWKFCEPDARSAIEAMREPTKAMIFAGDSAKEDCVDETWSSDDDGNRYDYTRIRSDISSRIFTAMIDAALAVTV